MAERRQCAARVWRSSGNWGREYACQKPAKIEEDGKWWCSTHAPSMVRERQAAVDRKWRQKSDAKTEAWKRQQAVAQAIAGYEDALIAGLLPKLLGALADLLNVDNRPEGVQGATDENVANALGVPVEKVQVARTLLRLARPQP